MLVVEQHILCTLRLRISEESLPIDYVVLILLIEDHLGVHEVLNDLLAATVLQELRPCSVNLFAFDVVMHEWIPVEAKRWSHVDVPAAEDGEQDEPEHRVQSGCHDRALA